MNNEVSGESAWNPVVWPFRVFFIVGFGLFALQAIAEILKSISKITGNIRPDMSNNEEGSL